MDVAERVMPPPTPFVADEDGARSCLDEEIEEEVALEDRSSC